MHSLYKLSSVEHGIKKVQFNKNREKLIYNFRKEGRWSGWGYQYTKRRVFKWSEFFIKRSLTIVISEFFFVSYVLDYNKA